MLNWEHLQQLSQRRSVSKVTSSFSNGIFVKKPPHFYVFFSPTFFFSQWSGCFISSSVDHGENPGPPTGYSELKTKATCFPLKETAFSKTEIYCFVV